MAPLQNRGEADASIDWEQTWAAVWNARRATLRPVRRLDSIALDDLLGVDSQKRVLCDNTERFLHGQRANHALLWGSRGTGKSSLIKALLNAYAPQGLRVVEVDKADLYDLASVVEHLEHLPWRFIVYCDDLSFEGGESAYKDLKSVLEGSIELPPDNVLLYATSNRRHLVSEPASDNQATRLVNGELHHADVVEERLSLADRFGIWLSFYPQSWSDYFAIIDSLFPQYSGDRAQLHEEARQFALGRASHSGRTARQFFLTRTGSDRPRA